MFTDLASGAQYSGLEEVQHWGVQIGWEAKRARLNIGDEVCRWCYCNDLTLKHVFDDCM